MQHHSPPFDFTTPKRYLMNGSKLIHAVQQQERQYKNTTHAQVTHARYFFRNVLVHPVRLIGCTRGKVIE
jgi:hypothetical protein